MKTQQTFEEYLKKNNLSGNTLDAYLWTVDFYHSHYDGVTKENLLAYKGYLMKLFFAEIREILVHCLYAQVDGFRLKKLH